MKTPESLHIITINGIIFDAVKLWIVVYEFTKAKVLEYMQGEKIPSTTFYNVMNSLMYHNIIYIKQNYSAKLNYYCFASNKSINDSENIRNYDYIYKQISIYTISRFENSRRMSSVILGFLESGIMSFTLTELQKSANVQKKTVQNFLRNFMGAGILKCINNKYWFCCYNSDDIFESDSEKEYSPEIFESDSEREYSPEIFELINQLCTSESSTKKDKRIGNIINSCLEKGIITEDDYLRINERPKMSTDMMFATQLGLVESKGDGSYRINRTLTTKLENIEIRTKAALAQLYKQYGESEFSVKMVIADLDYSKSHVNATLHRLTWLKVLDCKVDDNKRYCYQFLITPEDHPECFGTAA